MKYGNQEYESRENGKPEYGNEKPGNASSKTPQEKLEDLKRNLKELGSAAVAFSGGVDSAFLLKTAHDVLGSRTAAVTIKSSIFPDREGTEAKRFCKTLGIRQSVCELDAFSIPGFGDNPKNRCYLCKREILRRILETAKAQGFAFVVEGSNLDDDGDYRPGRQAVKELGVKSPLRDAGMTKADIRILSRQMGLGTWDKQSFACLASRFVYGEKITPQKLKMLDEAEQLLLGLGFHQLRVRMHGLLARIEVLPEEFGLLMQEREQVADSLKAYGFTYVTMDLKGYRTGSMNETLP